MVKRSLKAIIDEKLRNVVIRNSIKKQIRKASTYEDLHSIGRNLNYAIDNKLYGVGITNLQYKASKKMRKIYNRLGEYILE